MYFVGRILKGGAEAIIRTLRRFERLEKMTLAHTHAFYSRSLASSAACGWRLGEMSRIEIGEHRTSEEFVLNMLSCQHRYPPALPLIRKYFKDPECREAAFVCMLRHSQPNTVKPLLKMFRQLLAEGDLKKKYDNTDFDPVIAGFDYFRKYVSRYPEIRSLYYYYTSKRNQLLTEEQLDIIGEFVEYF